ncbi:tRNA 2-thiouridine(34) synthase MnmA [Chakrabartyella piscis]|uniref:tRNA 2-thiouridine(34) synthase MnmA n=1 Tax=Chakrabartyella piscis TaxID=2918914 RepID=UPI002958A7FF|nr:tRNA 2-thiouridine(34) synthase MnmA [Chakrabartyella piscis]
MEKEKVIVGMSGGVDSTVAAYLLKEQGYEVIGVTMYLWAGKEAEIAIADAKRVADQLGIEHIVLDFRDSFRKEVVDDFIGRYAEGLTPNPCVMCNRMIKGEALLQKAHELGAKYMATGHYARVEKHPVTGRYSIRNSSTAEKDQTYALYRLTQEQLQAMLLPIGEYTKAEVRQFAEKVDGFIAKKGDSQDICFIPDGDYAKFILEQGGDVGTAGSFVNMSGDVLGQHKGLIHYTVGQRKGLGIAFGKPMYVHSLDTKNNRVLLCENEELFRTTMYVGQVAHMSVAEFTDGMRLQGKIRYAHKAAWCTVRMVGEDKLECVFDEPQRAMTPGQSLVLYDGDFVAGGGIALAE